MPIAASLLNKLSFLLELFVNGSFILLSSLERAGRIPGFIPLEQAQTFIGWGVWAAPVVLLIVTISYYLSSDGLEDFLRRYVFSVIVVVPMFLTWGDIDFAFWLSSAHLLSSILALYDDNSTSKNLVKVPKALQNNDLFATLKMRPAQVIILIYAGVIALGTALLMIPFAVRDGQSLAFVDALFTAASALCITGLVTVSVVDTYSLFGQIVIISLVQIGGISIMALYSSMIILLGRSMGMKDRVIMQDVLDVSNVNELFSMVGDILRYTFMIEFWGAVILTIGFAFEGFEFSTALYYGIFHSISAFCQGGFTLFNSSFESFATNPIINFGLISLMILGSLGFIVIKECSQVLFYGRKIMNMGLHSKVSLITTFILIVVSFVMIFFGEFLYGLDGLSLFDKIQVTLFQTVTMRSAGLNSISLDSFQAYTVYGMALFMFIGGGSGSCAGGIKTTTFAIMAQSVISTLRGERNVQLLDRKIPGPIVVRAIAITFLYLLAICLTLFALVFFERDYPFLIIFFEAVSAVGTVGLSMGVTEFLSVPSKVLLSFMMLVGRIGPLTLIVAISQQGETQGKFDYPDGRIMIG